MLEKLSNKQEVANSYIHLLETSNSELAKNLNKSKRKNIFYFTSFAIVILFLAGTFIYKNYFFSSDIFDRYLPKVKYEEDKLLIGLNNETYYEIKQDTHLKFLANDKIFVEIKPAYIRFSLVDKTLEPIDIIYKIHVPKQKYKVILPDETEILLNKNSDLTFNLNRKTDRYNADLSGEAYFSVKHNPEFPFKVNANKIQIKVLGTEFNINNYPSSQTKVSLIKGSVMLSTNEIKTKLQPGEIAVFDKKEQKFDIKYANVLDDTNWTDNNFSFKQMKLSDIVKKLEKWYNIKFIIRDQDLKNTHFTGIISKKQGLKFFLNNLKYTENIKFSIKNNLIILTK